VKQRAVEPVPYQMSGESGSLTSCLIVLSMLQIIFVGHILLSSSTSSLLT